MDRATLIAAEKVVPAYTRFFLEDFRSKLLGYVSATTKITSEKLATIPLPDTIPAIKQDNAVTRFIFENALEALELYGDDAATRETWDLMCQAPTSHDDEITALAYNGAMFYLKTINETLINTVGSDVMQISQSIKNEVMARESLTQTGGVVHHFNWGILSDGMWLNGALNAAFDKLKIFRPGLEPNMSWARSAMDQAARDASRGTLRSEYEGDFGTLIAHADNSIMTSGSIAPHDPELHDILYKFGTLSNCVNRWSNALTNPLELVDSVRQLSNLAVTIPHLIHVATSLGDELVSQEMIDRLRAVEETVTFSLVAFNAARESRFGDKIVLGVKSHDQDPVVDVYVNKDLLNSFTSSGGSEEDLAHLGTYLTMKELDTVTTGWSMSWATKLKDEIAQEVLASEYDRLEKLRLNDRNVIRTVVHSTLEPVVESYISASGRGDMFNSAKNSVRDIAVRVSNPDAPYQMDRDLVKLLTGLTGDEQLVQVAESFLDHSTSADPEERALALGLTMVDAATMMVVSYL